MAMIRLLDDTTLLVSFSYSKLAVDKIKQLPPTARSWDQVRKAWQVATVEFENLLELFPMAAVHPDVWDVIYPTMGRRLFEAQAFWQGIAWSGVRLLERMEGGFLAVHDTADDEALERLQYQVNLRAPDLKILWDSGYRPRPAFYEDSAEQLTSMLDVAGEPKGLQDDPEGFMARNWEQWRRHEAKKASYKRGKGGHVHRP